MPFAVKMGNGGTGFLGHAASSQRAQQRAKERRAIKPGYPILTPFKTVEDVREYLSGETIVCLLCGRNLNRLGIHVEKIHGISLDDYRAKYAIPYGYPLASEATTEAYRAATLRRIANDDHALERLRGTLEQAREAMKGKKRSHRVAGTVRTQRAERITRKTSDRFWNSEHAEEIMRRVSTGRTPKEVLQDSDMPGSTWWRAYRREHPQYDSRFRSVMDAMPFPFQSQSQMLGERFKAEVVRQFRLGRSDKAIAKALGVTAMTCNRITKPLRSVKDKKLLPPPTLPPASPTQEPKT